MKRASAQEAAAAVRAVDTLAIPLGPGQPVEFLHALGAHDRFQGLTVWGALLADAFALFTRPGVTLLSGFFGPVERALRDAGHRVRFVPADFRRFVKIARALAPRVMATAAAPPDADGWCSLSLHAGATVGELERCGADPSRVLVVETSPHYPRTLGLPPDHRHALHLDQIDVLVESDRAPVTLPPARGGEVERAIALQAAAFVEEGCTLQIGIGGIPDAVTRVLAERDAGDYGIHTEMFTDGLMALHRAGKVSNARKGQHDGVSIATFALGSRALYDWLDAEGREQVRFLPVDEVNPPWIIARNRALVSMNGALSVDLSGQVVADQIDGRHYSGIGGHEDFVTGASFSPGGHSLVCLPSTASVRGEIRSRIVAAFPPGTCITTPRHEVDVVVTEYGAAELAGLTTSERRDVLTEIAHPDFRDTLRAASQGDA